MALLITPSGVGRGESLVIISPGALRHKAMLVISPGVGRVGAEVPVVR